MEMMMAKLKKSNTVSEMEPAPPVAPPVELTAEEIAAAIQMKVEYSAGQYTTTDYDPATGVLKSQDADKPKKAKVAPQVAPVTPKAKPPVLQVPKLAPVLSPSELAAKVQAFKDEADAAGAKLIQENEKAKLAAKLAAVDAESPVDVEAITARVKDKLESAKVQAGVDAIKQEQTNMAKELAPVRVNLVKEMDDLRDIMPQRDELAGVLGWDAAELERKKLFLPSQAGRYRWNDDMLRHAPRFLAQQEQALEELDGMPESGLTGKHLAHALKMLSDTITWSLGAGYNTRRAVRDMKKLLAELDATVLQAAPQVTAPGHAALKLMGTPAQKQQTHAIME